MFKFVCSLQQQLDRSGIFEAPANITHELLNMTTDHVADMLLLNWNQQ